MQHALDYHFNFLGLLYMRQLLVEKNNREISLAVRKYVL